MEDSVFTKIIKRQIPSTIRFEDDEFIAFDDIHPHAPIHVLVVPKKQYETLEQVPMEDTNFHARLLLIGREVARIMGISENYRFALNIGKELQAVHHVHLHVLGGWKNLPKARDQRFG
ncbi:MAG TPA: HIT domain-containing protein [Patescibacteria group bacterium]|nr:HIT domain-containing protein [Patescibacteria group bacterium]